MLLTMFFFCFDFATLFWGQSIPWTKSLGLVQVITVGPNGMYSLDQFQLDQVINTCLDHIKPHVYN